VRFASVPNWPVERVRASSQVEVGEERLLEPLPVTVVREPVDEEAKRSECYAKSVNVLGQSGKRVWLGLIMRKVVDKRRARLQRGERFV
jgi:hypothetical protein